MSIWTPELEIEAVELANSLSDHGEAAKKAIFDNASRVELAAMALALYAVGTAQQAAAIAAVNLAETRKQQSRIYDAAIGDVRRLLLSRRDRILTYAAATRAFHVGDTAGRA